MPDWTKPMEQSYEYYTVEPTTLADVKRLDTVTGASFSRDSETDTLGSATLDCTSSFGESYIRGYLKTVQNGITERHPLGTVLVQTPSSSYNGRVMKVSMDAYTPLIELKENAPPLGYTIRKGTRIMDAAYRIVRDKCRVPVNKIEPRIEGDVDRSPILDRDFTANTDDTWLTFVIDLIARADYELGLDARGHILFQPIQELDSLQPVWTYTDDNSSILLPDITISHDLYGLPNVLEVVYSYGGVYKEAVAINDDPNSPISTVNRGRRISVRDTRPSISGYVTDEQLQAYADKLLARLSTVEYTVSYKHAYCPVRIGDCVRLNYRAPGLSGVKAKVISQNIFCKLGCPVSEKAVFTKKLWR